MKAFWLAGLIVVLFAGMAGAAARDDILIADFEGKDYGDWKTTGEAFGSGPAHGTLPNQQNVSGFLGKGLVNSYLNGDRATGTLTSPELKIERAYINFLIGGGAHAGKTCINLLVDGKVVRTATGAEDELLDWSSWDVSDLAGKMARIEIVDNETGGWGHINIDQITQSDVKKQQAGGIVSDELYNETYRPQFHFSPRQNWTNDPNGLVFYKGQYHLFFQHNPKANVSGNMTWGHATSGDLVHWEQLENALLPDKLGTMFSGSAVVDWNNTAGFAKGDEKTIVLIYTAAGGTSAESKGQPFTQCIAYSTDAGKTFTKYEQNPVLKHIAGGNRDPKVVWHEPTKKWVMALFLDGNEFAFFNSPDLKNWQLLQKMKVPDCGECPDFFPMPVDGDSKKIKWVWTAANGRYLVGDFDGAKFTPDQPGALRADWGKNYYAVQTYSDIPESDGRRIQVAWMNGGKYPRMPFNQQMSFPCEMKLRTFPEGLRICRTPIHEIDELHAKEKSWKDVAIKPGENLLAGLSGDLFDIRATIDPADAEECGFKIRGETVSYSANSRKISCLGNVAQVPAANGPVQMQILVDRASLEVFVSEGRVGMTSCFVPRPENKSLELFSTSGAAKLISLQVFELQSIWKKK